VTGLWSSISPSNQNFGADGRRKGWTVSHSNVLENTAETQKTWAGARVQSFDSGYEHSLEHWLSLRAMLEDADDDDRNVTSAWLYSLGVKA
jgi:hypothetical protein